MTTISSPQFFSEIKVGGKNLAVQGYVTGERHSSKKIHFLQKKENPGIILTMILTKDE